MKKNKIRLVLVPLVIFGTSCKKEFLDLKPYNSIPLSLAIQNEADLQSAVHGVYSTFRSANLHGRTIPLIGDLLADNVYIATVNSNRYIGEFNYAYTNQFGQSLTTMSDAYTGIQRANNVIDLGLKLPPSATVSQLRGEAMALRALLYFELVKLFGKPYTVDPNSLGVPLVLAYNPTLKPARNTVAEVYTQIEKDLSDAFTLVTATTSPTKNSSYVSKYVVRALQAKVAFNKGDYTAAKTFALDVVANGGFTLVSAANYNAYWNGFAPTSNRVETIFEISHDAVQNAGNNSLAYFYFQTGYGDAVAADDLYNQYSATDVRRTRMVATTRSGQNIYAVTKFPNVPASSPDKDDVKIIRYSEILLILAESYARTNDDANARTTLNQVAQIRDPSFTGYTSSGATLIEDIINERRKELAFEGNRYWDLLRLNRDIIRINLNNNYPPSTPLTLPTTSHKRIWPIHQTERDANPNMEQNPNY
jgi:hypothetical protein